MQPILLHTLTTVGSVQTAFVITVCNTDFKGNVGQGGHDPMQFNGRMASAVAVKLFTLGFFFISPTEKTTLTLLGIVPLSPE
uniref:Uncharacterized protein n=1 Tax=Arion vulgaris TaxID=1028688 RepID=A0A0B7B0T8_9EUPU